jgi:arginase family enzyme
MKTSTVVMNFTEIYENETFYKNFPYQWIDCTNITGTNCYCDEIAEQQLKIRIKDDPPDGVHFIDSGNYHYMSKLWTDKITQSFVLVVFDHHPDMQPSMFDSLMSCGCWLKSVLDTNCFLKKVVLIGVADSLMSQVEEKYQDRILCYSENRLMTEKTWDELAAFQVNEPVYISIDKDVLNTKDAKTNWDQGTMTLADMKSLLHMITGKHKIIGVDICGECANLSGTLTNQEEMIQNDRTNQEILQLLYHNFPE